MIAKITKKETNDEDSDILNPRSHTGIYESKDPAVLSCRFTPAALVFMAMNATNAPETSAAGAPIMGSVRTVWRGTGSVVAMKVSMVRRARTVSRDDTESTAPRVRHTPTVTKTHPLTHSRRQNQSRSSASSAVM